MSKTLFFLTMLLLFSSQESLAFDFYKEITIQHDNVMGSGHSDFPVLIKHTDPDLRDIANGGKVQQSQGYDIAFSLASDGSPLEHELTFYNPSTGELACWVKVPYLSGLQNTTIHINYGDVSVITDPSSADTWDNGFRGVYHFDKNPFEDASNRAGDLTNNGGTLTGGQHSQGVFLDDNNLGAGITSELQIRNDLTLDIWVNLSDMRNGKFDNSLFSCGGVGPGDVNNFLFWFNIDARNTGNIRLRSFWEYTGGNNEELASDAGIDVNVGEWTKVTLTKNSTDNEVSFYQNGIQVGTARSYTNEPTGGTQAYLWFGKDQSVNSDYLTGIIDEARISDVLRSSDWLRTDYLNQSAGATYDILAEPNAFYEIGTERSQLIPWTPWGDVLISTTSDRSYGTVVDPLDSSLYAVGRTESPDLFSNVKRGHQGGFDGFVTKRDNNGVELWSSYIGGSDWDECGDIAIDESGNIYVTGFVTNTGSFDSVLSGDHQGSGGRDAFLTKISTNGEIIWFNTYGGIEADLGLNVEVIGARVYLTIRAAYSGLVINGTQPGTGWADGERHFAILGVEAASGAVNWVRYFGSNGDDYSDELVSYDHHINNMVDIEVSQNGIYLAVITDNTNLRITNEPGTYYNISLGANNNLRPSMLNLGLDGSVIAHLVMRASSDDNPNYHVELAMDCDHTYTVVKRRPSPGADFDFQFEKWSKANGTLDASSKITTSENTVEGSSIYNLIEDGLGRIVGAGQFSSGLLMPGVSGDFNVNHTATDGQNLLLVTLRTSDLLVSARETIGDAGDESYYGIDITGDQVYGLTGWANNANDVDGGNSFSLNSSNSILLRSYTPLNHSDLGSCCTSVAYIDPNLSLTPSATPNIGDMVTVTATGASGTVYWLMNTSDTDGFMVVSTDNPFQFNITGETKIRAAVAGDCGTRQYSNAITLSPIMVDPVIDCPVDLVVNAAPGVCSSNVDHSVTAVNVNGDNCIDTTLANHSYIGELNGHRYFKSDASMNWPDSKSAADALGGHLVTITSEEENDLLIPAGTSWMGFTDEAVGGDWVWITGEAVTYTDWAPNEPNNLFDQDHGIINVNSNDQWDDFWAVSSVPYIVEFECSVDQVQGPAPGSSFPLGSTTITYQATDDQGNSSICDIAVIVNEVEPPIINCPLGGDTSVYAGIDGTYTLEDGFVNATDICSDSSIMFIEGLTYIGALNGHSYYLSDSIRTWDWHRDYAQSIGGYLTTIDDNAENSFLANKIASGSFIGLHDSNVEGTWEWANGDPFVYSAWQDLQPDNNGDADYVGFYPSASGSNWDDWIGSATSNGIIEFDEIMKVNANIEFGPQIGDVLQCGTSNPISYIVCDEAGNTARCNFNIRVEDNIPPTPDLTTLSDVIAECSYTPIAPTATDNCGGAVSITTTTGTITTVGTHTITWEFSDGTNTVEHTQLVNIVDTEDPVITSCPSLTDLVIDEASCEALMPDYTGLVVATDCTLLSRSQSIAPNEPLTTGSYDVIFTVSDINGQSSACPSTTFLVIDNTVPNLVCANDTVVNMDSGVSCQATEIFLNAPIIENYCGAETLSTSPTTFPLDTTYVTWTLGTAECVQRVIVKDDEAPIAICRTDEPFFNFNALGEFNLNPGDIDAGSADDCSSWVYSLSETDFTCTDAGNVTVELTVTDEAGNSSTCVADIVLLGTPAPTGASLQSFCLADNPTLNDITVSGSSIIWYTSSSSVTPLFSGSTLANGITYYASQTENCESTDRLSVTVSVSSDPTILTSTTGQFCSSEEYTHTATIDNADSLLWISSGDGFFNDSTLLNASYTPGPTDIINGSVVFDLTAYGQGSCGNSTTSISLIIDPAPNAGSGWDAAYCQNTAEVDLFVTLSQSPEITGSWSSVNGSAVLSESIFNPIDHSSGVYDFIYVVEGSGICANDTSFVEVNLNPMPVADAGWDKIVCINAAVTMDASTEFATTVEWATVNGDGSFTDPYAEDAEYNPAGNDVLNSPIALVMTALGGSQCSGQAHVDTVWVTVTGLPNAGQNASHTVCSTDPELNLFDILGDTPDIGGTWSGFGSFVDYKGAITPSEANSGTYTYTVTAAGCLPITSQIDLTIDQSPDLAFINSSSLDSCGIDNGSITLSLSNFPDGAYTIDYAEGSWSVEFIGGQAEIKNLPAEVYDNIALTINGCTSTADIDVTLTEPMIPTLSISEYADPLSCGSTDGSINLLLENAAPGFYDVVYNGGVWTNVDFTSGVGTISSLGVGPYDNIIVSVNLCSSIDVLSETLIEPQTPSITIIDSTNPSTCSGTDGSISIEVPGFSGMHDVYHDNDTWSDVSFTGGSAVISGLTQGQYNNIGLTVSGCSSIENPSVELSDPSGPVLTVMSVVQPSTCGGAGSITFELEGVDDGWYSIENAPVDSALFIGGVTTISPLPAGVYGDYQAIHNGCSSNYSETVTLTDPPAPAAPEGDASQSFCTSAPADIAHLIVSGSNLTWYSDAALINSLLVGHELVDGETYYVTSTENQCESTALAISVSSSLIPTAIVGEDQSICAGETVALNGTPANGIVEWSSPTSGTFSAISSASTDYTPSDLDISNGSVILTMSVTGQGACIDESDQASLEVSIQNTAAPTGPANQEFCPFNYMTVTDLQVSASGDVHWYNQFIGGAELSPSDTLQTGSYYASQVLSDCESNTRLEVSVLVEDSEAPTPDNTLLDIEVFACEHTIPTTMIPTASDNCDPIVSGTTGMMTFSAPTNTTITWFFEDSSGNISQQTQVVKVIDNAPPTVTCLSDIIVPLDADCQYTLPDFTNDLNAIDNCGGTLITEQLPVEGTSLMGHDENHVVTLTVIDASGNSTTCSFVINTRDQLAPMITSCPDDIITQTLPDATDCFAYVEVPLATASDDCGMTTLKNDFTNTDNASAMYPEGLTQVTWTATDAIGNIQTCEQDITVNDATAPVLGVTAFTLELDANCQYILEDLTEQLEIDDNCTDFNNLTITSSYDVGDVLTTTTSVQYTVTDASENSVVADVLLTLIDAISPSIECSGDENITALAGQCSAMIDVAEPSHSDCSGSVLMLQTGVEEFNSGEYPMGTTVLTWIAVDTSGNSSTCTTTVTVSPNAPPAIFCPEDITVSCDLDMCSADLEIDKPEVEGFCAPLIENSFNNEDQAYGLFPIGTTIVTYLVEEGDNSSSCEVEVTVLDTVAPVIVLCPPAREQCGLEVILEEPIVTDCQELSYVNDFNFTNDATGFYPDGMTTVTWIATDESGNTATCITEVDVQDNSVVVNAGPELALDYQFEFQLEASLPEGQTGYWTALNGGVMFDDITSPFAIATLMEVGTVALEWTVDYGHCGIHTDTMTVTILDFLIPTGFSPNGDGINDTYHIRGLERVGDISLRVLTRWGTVAFESDSYQNDWDGTSSSGNLLPVDTYYYIIELADGEIHKGSLELRR